MLRNKHNPKKCLILLLNNGGIYMCILKSQHPDMCVQLFIYLFEYYLLISQIEGLIANAHKSILQLKLPIADISARTMIFYYNFPAKNTHIKKLLIDIYSVFVLHFNPWQDRKASEWKNSLTLMHI